MAERREGAGPGKGKGREGKVWKGVEGKTEETQEKEGGLIGEGATCDRESESDGERATCEREREGEGGGKGEGEHAFMASMPSRFICLGNAAEGCAHETGAFRSIAEA